MRLHIPLSLLSALLAGFVGTTQALPSADSTAWTSGTSFNNDSPGKEYAVTSDGSVNLGIASNTTNFSTGVYIANGVTFTVNQNTGGNGSCAANWTGAITGDGTLVFSAANANNPYASVLILSSEESNFSGNIIVSQKGTQVGGSILRLSGTGMKAATVDLTSSQNTNSIGAALEIADGGATIAGLHDASGFTGTHKGRVQAVGSTAVTLTLAGSGDYAYGGSVGSTDSYFRRVDKDNVTVTTGAITLSKTGSGTQVLSGSVINADLSVSDGTLTLNNSGLTYTHAVTVAGGTVNLQNLSLGNGFKLTGSGAGQVKFSSVNWGNLTSTTTLTPGSASVDFGNAELGSAVRLSMNGSGSFSNVTLNGVSLVYTSATEILSSSNVTCTSGSINIDSLDYTTLGEKNDEGFYTLNLGLTLNTGFTVSGLSSDSYRLEGSTLYFKGLDIAETTWTWANGSGGQSTQTLEAKVLRADGSNTNISLAALNGSITNSGDIVYVVNNTGTTKISVAGVYNSGAGLTEAVTFTGNVWMDLQSGSFGTVFGGVLNQWANTLPPLYTSTLTGDTHVQLSGTAQADHVVGGNLKGASTTITGNTNVSVLDGALVNGYIIGGSTSAHAKTPIITGDSSVLVTGVQYSNSASNLDNLGNIDGNKLIVGGSSWTSNYSGTQVNGNTSVTIDLTNATLSTTDTSHNSFNKVIIGGGYGNSTYSSYSAKVAIGGNSSVYIKGKDGVTFTGNIVGGLYESSTNAKITYTLGGNALVEISGASTYNGAIYGGTFSQNTSGALGVITLSGNATVNLGSGSTFLGDIVVAGNKGTLTGDATLNLNAGSTFGNDSHAITIAGTTGTTVNGLKQLNLIGNNFTPDTFRYVTFSNFASIDNASDVTLYKLTDSPTLTKTGDGTLTLGSDATSSTAVISGLINLTLKAGSIVFTNGDASQWSGDVSMEKGTTLSGLSGTLTVGGENGLTSLTMVLSTENIGEGSAATSAMINGADITIADTGLTIDLTNDGLIDLLLTHKNAGKESYLTLTTGTLTCSDETLGTIVDTNALLFASGIHITGTNGGSLVLSGEASGIYDVTSTVDSKPHEVDGYPLLSGYEQVVIAQNQGLQVNLDGEPTALDGDGVVINNLSGASDSTLQINNSNADQTAVVILNNTLADGTTMSGDISESGDGAVSFLKQGDKSLTVDGNITATEVRVQEGTLTLNGDANELSNLILDSTDGDTLSTTTIGGTVDAALTEENNGGNLVLNEGGTLNVTGDSSLSSSQISGEGTLVVGQSSGNADTLTLSGSSGLTDSNISINGGDMTVTDQATLDAGTLTMTEGGMLTLEGGGNKTYTLASVTTDEDSLIDLQGGTLKVTGTDNSTLACGLNGSGTLVVENGNMHMNGLGNSDIFIRLDNASMQLSGAEVMTMALSNDASGISALGVSLVNNSTLSVGDTNLPNQRLILGDAGLTVSGGSTLSFVLDTTMESEFTDLTPLVITSGAIDLQNGATVELLNSSSLVTASNRNLSITLMESTGGTDAQVGDVVFSAAFLETVYENLTLSASGSNVILTGTERRNNLFSSTGFSDNAQAGAEMLWESRYSMGDSDSTLKDTYLGVYNMVQDGDTSTAAKVMAGIAGSTVNATGTAQRAELQTQLGRIRNRTVTMGVNPNYINDDLPYFHMWVEGIGGTSRLNTRGDEGGYSLNNWGGVIGIDVDLSDRLTLGAAFTATYGTLSSSAAEQAHGDLDGYYATLFGRYQNRAWSHTIILTGAWNNATLNRTVNYGNGSYSTRGDTNGSGFGAMYEVAYDIALNENKSSVLQPLFNASVINTTLDAYTETGAGNAGLRVGKQTWTTGTLAAGVRWLGLAGTNLFGREALVELRANVAQDFGDEQGETEVSLIGNPSFTQRVRGAKVGSTAGQFGIGISIPIGIQCTVFCNGTADIRSGAHSLNAAVGFRYHF